MGTKGIQKISTKEMVSVEAADLIPHTPPMRMIDKIVSFDDSLKSSVSEATVRSSFPFLDDDGDLLPSAYLELIAQASAAQHGFNLQRNGSSEEEGFLVGVRNLSIHSTARIGDTLTIHIQLGTEIDVLSVVAGSVSRGETLLAEAEITVWHGVNVGDPTELS